MMRWVKGEEGERVRIGDGIKRGEKKYIWRRKNGDISTGRI